MKIAKYNNQVLTLDTIEALKALESKNKIHDFISYIESSENEKWNLTRRCLSIKGDTKKIWSFAIPLGFTPWDRYLCENGSSDYFFFGKWTFMMDRLMACGRGDAVWNSFLVASRLEAGTWPKDDRFVERSIQAELHRLGYNPGPLDGVIGKETTRVLSQIGIKDRLEITLQNLKRQKPKSEKKNKIVKKGELYFPDSKLQVFSYGDIRVERTQQGAKVEAHGSGRIILDIQN